MVTPVGSPLTVTVTVPVKPFAGVACNVICDPGAPSTIVSLCGVTASEKSAGGGGGRAIVTATVAVWVSEPELPVRVSVPVPAWAEAPALKVTVCAAPGARLRVDGLAVTPAGSPVNVTVTTPVNPFTPVVETLICVVDPVAIATTPGLTRRPKSPLDPPQPVITPRTRLPAISIHADLTKPAISKPAISKPAISKPAISKPPDAPSIRSPDKRPAGSDETGSIFVSPSLCSSRTREASKTSMIRKNIPGSSPYEPVIGFSRAVRVGPHVYVSGTGPVGADDTDPATQTEQCLTIIAAALKEAGSSIEHVVRTRVYLTDAQHWEEIARIHGKFFSITRPAATMVVVAALLNPAWHVEIEADAHIPE